MPPVACKPRHSAPNTSGSEPAAIASHQAAAQTETDFEDDDIHMEIMESDVEETTKLPSETPTTIRTTDEAQKEIDKVHSEEDERRWQSWYRDAMPLAVSKLIPEPDPEPRVSKFHSPLPPALVQCHI